MEFSPFFKNFVAFAKSIQKHHSFQVFDINLLLELQSFRCCNNIKAHGNWIVQCIIPSSDALLTTFVAFFTTHYLVI